MSTSTVTKQTRKASYEHVKKTLGQRQSQVYSRLERFPEGCTASELAMDLFVRGMVSSPDRNFVHPRLNELVGMGYVEITGKRTCSVTNKTVAVYKTRER